MRTFATALGLIALGGLLAASPAAARTRQTPEQQLARMLEGRTAGKPVDCLTQMDMRQSTVIDRTAIVYSSGAGGTLWVNRPDNARSLDDSDVLVTDLRGTSQLCSVDVVRLYDRNSRFYTGFVGLGQFVPYTRTAKPG